MRYISIGVAVVSLGTSLGSAHPPTIQQFLHSGELAKGEQTLEGSLAAAPKDDQVRFSLGVIRFVRAIERLGQSLYEYGTKSENTNIPFLRLPVPKNPDPAPISYMAFRRVADDCIRDLNAAEATLVGVTDDRVKLPLRLNDIRLDLDNDGKPTDKFIDILKTIMRRQQFDFLKTNPDFLVHFDRGDVAWLRAYCHLLAGMLDFYLAFDTEQQFNLSAGELFARPKNPFKGSDEEKLKLIEKSSEEIIVKEPARLGRFRQHLIQVAELNKETWKYIRAEADDNHEWLPNPKQKGVLGMPVRNAMIDSWLKMVAEMEALLEGKRTFSKILGLDKDGKGLNLKVLLDDPPEKLVSRDRGVLFPQTLHDKYFSDDKEVDIFVVFNVMQVFGDTTAVGYAFWFN